MPLECGSGRWPERNPRRRAEFVPPYDPSKFPNKWTKMNGDLPARTLMAHLGKDTYSHIHYDSAQARTITVCEAARLQSFPDGFHFSGTMNPAFRQIGNAVPPLLAYAVGRRIVQRPRAAKIRPLRGCWRVCCWLNGFATPIVRTLRLTTARRRCAKRRSISIRTRFTTSSPPWQLLAILPNILCKSTGSSVMHPRWRSCRTSASVRRTGV